jgi:hypothetical protein
MSVADAINERINEHRAAIEQVAGGINSILATFSMALVELTNSAKNSFDARMKLYPALKGKILPLAKRGWFVSTFFGLSELDLLAQSASTLTPDDLDLLIAQLYREGIAKHGQEMLKEYPGRAFLLRPAMDAHLRGEYAISIPIYFILVDGICFERAQKYLFQESGDMHIASHARAELGAIKEQAVENSITGFFSLMSGIIWESISEKPPLAYNEKARNAFQYDGLNRHTVLHGIADQNYATEENSLKVFSLLSCIAGLLAKSD